MICKLKRRGGEEKKRGQPRKSTRQPRISDTSHLERKFQCLGGKLGARSGAACSGGLRSGGTKPGSLRAPRSGTRVGAF